MSVDVETIIVGAGVVGLAIGRALARKGGDVLVLEQHGMIGAETSSRNSQVIHAGIYYQPGSLRARLCLRGAALLYQFCTDNGVTFNRCGKLLVATSARAVPHLRALAGQAEQNGVTDLRLLSRQDALAMEPELDCIAACLSPSTGIIDSHELMVALEGHIASSGGQVILGTKVTGLAHSGADHFEVTTISGGEASCITSSKLVLSGGLHGTDLARMLFQSGGSYRPPVTYPAKGHYFTLTGRAPFAKLIYPMPDGAWLGVHLSLDTGGQAKFGPDIEWTNGIDYSFDDPDGRRKIFAREIKRYYPRLDAARLQPGYTGIRPKIYAQGEAVADFAIHGRERHGVDDLVALYGIESPGLTSSLAIGEHVADLLGYGLPDID